MAKVKDISEKLHYQLYDDFVVPEPLKEGTGFASEPTFQTEMRKRDPRVIRFFVDVQNKTRLDTNLQAAGVLPSLNTFEARAMRVVAASISEITNKRPKNGSTLSRESTVLAELIYNSVITFLVGEKIMIEAPTFYFPAGAGVTPGSPFVANHGEADPMATFRFAEPVIIAPQQNFRVEMLFPQGVPGQGPPVGTLANILGPWRIWVVLDGYLTRDVQ
jgi:hypothetical protein